MTEKGLDNGIFSIEEIGNIIQVLDPNQTHGKGKISIRILKTVVTQFVSH